MAPGAFRTILNRLHTAKDTLPVAGYGNDTVRSVRGRQAMTWLAIRLAVIQPDPNILTTRGENNGAGCIEHIDDAKLVTVSNRVE
jgi:hypothetical protein